MKRRAFTLMEMLVAIAILAVLVALAFPALNAARDRTHVAGCLNNLRQIGVAALAYAGDNNGYLPQGDTPKTTPGTGNLVWPYKIAPYLGIKDFAKTYQDAALARRSPFACPAEKDFSAAAAPWIHYSLTRHLNERIFGDLSRVPLAAIRSPSKWMIVSDSFKSWNLLTDSAGKMTNEQGVTRRHRGIPNFLYADGHAAPFTKPILGESDPGGQDPFYRALWDPRYAP